MRNILLAISALFLSGTAAVAGPMTLDASPTAQARPVINIVFGDYLAQRVAAQVQTGVVDLDKDGVGDIVARFVHSASCQADMKTCRTVVLRHDGTSWKIVFDHPTATIEVMPGGTGVPAPIKADKVTWNWNYPVYAPTVDGIGDGIDLSSVPANTVASLAPAFGQGAVKLLASNPSYRLSFARPNLSAKAEFIAVNLAGGAACGEKIGCPVRILMKEAAGWRPILSTSSKSTMFVGNKERAGYRDFIVDTPTGFTVYGWNGEKYALADRVDSPSKDQK